MADAARWHSAARPAALRAGARPADHLGMRRRQGPWWLELLLLAGALAIVGGAFALWPDSQHGYRLAFMGGGMAVLIPSLIWLQRRSVTRQWAPWPTRGPLAAARRWPGAGVVAAIHRHGGAVMLAFFMIAWLIWMVAQAPSGVMRLLDGDLSGLLPVVVTALLVLLLIAAVAGPRPLNRRALVASLEAAQRRREQEARR